jgi:hypothetical protein
VMICSIVTDVLLFMTVLYRHFTKHMIRHSVKQCQVFDIIICILFVVLSLLVLMTGPDLSVQFISHE